MTIFMRYSKTRWHLNNSQEDSMMSLNCQGTKDVFLSGERHNSLPFAILTSIVNRFEWVGGNVCVRRNKRKKKPFFFCYIRYKASNFFVSLLQLLKDKLFRILSGHALEVKYQFWVFFQCSVKAVYPFHLRWICLPFSCLIGFYLVLDFFVFLFFFDEFWEVKMFSGLKFHKELLKMFNFHISKCNCVDCNIIFLTTT